jgi:hypothetical protein
MMFVECVKSDSIVFAARSVPATYAVLIEMNTPSHPCASFLWLLEYTQK